MDSLKQIFNNPRQCSLVNRRGRLMSIWPQCVLVCTHATHCMALHTCVCVSSWNTNQSDLQTQRRSSDTFQSALPSCKSSHFLPALPPPAEWTVRRIVERSLHYSRPLEWTGWARLNKGLVTKFYAYQPSEAALCSVRRTSRVQTYTHRHGPLTHTQAHQCTHKWSSPALSLQCAHYGGSTHSPLYQTPTHAKEKRRKMSFTWNAPLGRAGRTAHNTANSQTSTHSQIKNATILYSLKQYLWIP